MTGAALDVHAHAVLPEYQTLLRDFGVAVPDIAIDHDVMTDAPEAVARRIALMDSAGVRRQLLSPIFPPYLSGATEATAAAATVNDRHASLARQYPDRLGVFAALPLPHIDQSVAELARCFDELGMVGVSLHCSCLGESLAAERFDPLYEELDRREAVVFFHPCVNGLHASLLTGWGLAPSVGTVFEDTVIALHLIIRGHQRTFPRVKFIVPHLGGALPMLLHRLDNQLPVRESDERPSVTARRFWYDTVAHGSPEALRCAVAAFGVDRLVIGSDYPVLLSYETYADTVGHVRNIGLDDPEIAGILAGNATALLGGR